MHKIDFNIINKLVGNSLNNLFKSDKELINIENIALDDINKHAAERSIVFRFGIYLNEELKKYPDHFTDTNLDVEYNRYNYDIKKVDEKSIFPDLIIHSRHNQDKNILVVEFKTWWNNNTYDDEKKLKAFTRNSGKFRYDYGLSLIIDKDIKKTKESFKWFFNYTLHNAMKIILQEHTDKPMHADELANEIYKRNLYFKEDGTKAEYNQIRARCNNYSDMFEALSGNHIKLKE
ncbi:MAG: hypothetical protein ABF289_11840 [Clostridiales bacterium]